MKKYLKKIFSLVMVFALVAVSAMALQVKPVKANSGVTIYFHNTLGWKQVYVYTFNGSTAVGQAWPGSAMTSIGNGWYKYSYTSDKALNPIFNNNDSVSVAQTNNVTPADLSVSKSAYWFVPASGDSKNAYGKTAVDVKVYTDAKSAGFTAASNTSTNTNNTSSTSTNKSTNTTGTTDSTPKTGDSNTAAVVGIVGLVSLIAMCAVIGKKKAEA